MKTSKKGGRLGSLLFFIPLIVIGVAVLTAFLIGDVGGGNGTLNVQALGYQYHSAQSIVLNVQASVNGTVVTTPASLDLPPGHYVVTFSSVAGYGPPSARHVIVQSRVATYAVGGYEPIERVIQFTGSYISATHVVAVHGVTPVIWVNISSQVVALQSKFWGQLAIQPGENTSLVFQFAGTYTFWIFTNQNLTGTISVS